MASAATKSERAFWGANAVVSALAIVFLGWLLLGRDRHSVDLASVSFLPTLNAVLNATAAVLLTLGWRAIRRGDRRVHPYYMIGAFVASTLFLVSYVVYHWIHGDSHYRGPLRPLYLIILASHVLLSTAVVPLCLAAFWMAWRGHSASHRSIGRVLVPIWLYVSVTGVVVYFFLRNNPPA